MRRNVVRMFGIVAATVVSFGPVIMESGNASHVTSLKRIPSIVYDVHFASAISEAPCSDAVNCSENSGNTTVKLTNGKESVTLTMEDGSVVSLQHSNPAWTRSCSGQTTP